LLGTCFSLQEPPDSALVYQQQALDIAIAHCDTVKWSNILQSLSGIYRKAGKLVEAKTCALQSVDLLGPNKLDINALLNLAVIYDELHHNDSAMLYISRIQQVCAADSTKTLPAYVQILLANIAGRENDYKKAMAHNTVFHNRQDQMTEEEKVLSVAGIEEQHQIAEQQTDLQIKAQIISRKSQWMLWISIVLVLVIGLFFIFHTRHLAQKRKEKTRQEAEKAQMQQVIEQAQAEKAQAQQVIEQAQQKIEQAQEEVERIFTDRIADLRKDIDKDQSRIKKMSKKTAENPNPDEAAIEKANEELKNNTCTRVESMLKDRYGTAVDQLKTMLLEKKLTEIEFIICCFAFVGFSEKETAALLRMNENTLRSEKYAIRKKLGVSGKKSIRRYMAQALRQLLTENSPETGA
jgi:DNA-binding CsgD family transcriptional regulator